MHQNLHQNSHQFCQFCQSDQNSSSDQKHKSNCSWNYFVSLNSCKLLKRYKIWKCPAFSSTDKEKVFWKFHYVICRASLSLNAVSESVCLNSDCIMIIDDWDWIKKHHFNLKIHQMKSSIMIREIETIRYLTNEFIILNIYIFRLINDKIEMIEIIMKVHLVCNLKIKLLIDINVLDSEEMNISFCNCFLIINDKNEWETSIHIHTKNNTCIHQKIQAFKK